MGAKSRAASSAVQWKLQYLKLSVKQILGYKKYRFARDRWASASVGPTASTDV